MRRKTKELRKYQDSLPGIMVPRVIYISYDGMLEPLGQSQVVAYLRTLSVFSSIFLISFEKKSGWLELDRRLRIGTDIETAGIKWIPLRYHKSPTLLATAFDILLAIGIGILLVFKAKARIIHARSYVAAIVALTLKKITGANFIFDMRGFWADERIDGGIWKKESLLYPLSKWFEKQFLLNADHVISLTDAAVLKIKRFSFLAGKIPPITVIPTCVDLNRFRPLTTYRKEFIFGYVGTVGSWYQFDAVLDCFKIVRIRQPASRFLILNNNENEFIRKMLVDKQVPLSSVEILSVSHEEVPLHINRVSIGIFFIKPLYSKIASAPTKLAEFLGCGIPCLSNFGVGDVGDVLESDRVGVAVSDFRERSLVQGIDRVMALMREPDITDRCRRSAEKRFSLESGVEKYALIYKSLSV